MYTYEATRAPAALVYSNWLGLGRCSICRGVGVTGGGSSICPLHRDAIKDYQIIAAGFGWAVWSATSGHRPLPTICLVTVPEAVDVRVCRSHDQTKESCLGQVEQKHLSNLLPTCLQRRLVWAGKLLSRLR